MGDGAADQTPDIVDEVRRMAEHWANVAGRASSVKKAAHALKFAERCRQMAEVMSEQQADGCNVTVAKAVESISAPVETKDPI